jgi:Tfp pilus assembly protein PilO
MSLRTPARLALVIAAVALAAAAAGWFLLVSGQRSEASQVQQDLDAASSALTQKRTELNSLRGIAGVAPPNVLERALPDETSMPDVMTELSRLGDESGVAFTSLTPSSPVAGAGFTVTSLDAQFVGNWSQISSFVAAVRRLVRFDDGRLNAAGRLYSVRKVDLAEGEAKFPQLTAALTLDVFNYGTTAAAGEAATSTTSTAAPAAS